MWKEPTKPRGPAGGSSNIPTHSDGRLLRKVFKKVNGPNEQGYRVQRVTRATPRPGPPPRPLLTSLTSRTNREKHLCDPEHRLHAANPYDERAGWSVRAHVDRTCSRAHVRKKVPERRRKARVPKQVEAARRSFVLLKLCTSSAAMHGGRVAKFGAPQFWPSWRRGVSSVLVHSRERTATLDPAALFFRERYLDGGTMNGTTCSRPSKPERYAEAACCVENGPIRTLYHVPRPGTWASTT